MFKRPRSGGIAVVWEYECLRMMAVLAPFSRHFEEQTGRDPLTIAIYYQFPVQTTSVRAQG